MKEIAIDALNRGLEAPLEIRMCKEKGKIDKFPLLMIIVLGKGRGVFALQNIPEGSFICEYKTTGVYSTQQYKLRELEYKQEEEICASVEAKVNSKTMHFDGTRRYNQFGIYINHSITPNIKPFPPVFVRGKHRIGFFSSKPIQKNEELHWDYCYRDPKWPWLYGKRLCIFLIFVVLTSLSTYYECFICNISLGIKEEPEEEEVETCEAVYSKAKSTTFEKYRRAYFCPVPGCPSGKAIKKLSNHLIDFHKILDVTMRRKLLEEAKEPGPAKMSQRKVSITLEQVMQKLEKHGPANLIVPKIAAKTGSTKHYPRYDVDREPILTAFIKNLVSVDGGRRRPEVAREIASDVSKYLAYVNHRVCTWQSLLNIEKCRTFVEQLEMNKIGADGITSKLDRIMTAMTYVRREGLIQCFPQAILDRIDSWRGSYRRDKPALDIARQIEEPSESIFPTVQMFFANETLNHDIAEIRSKLNDDKELSRSEITLLTTYLFMCLTYKNWQRPGAVIRMTLEEAQAYVMKDNKLVVKTFHHKTGQAHGPAVMVLDGDDATLFQMYLNKVRINISTSSSTQSAFVTSHGSPLTNYRDLVHSLTNRLGIPLFPNITAVRKAGATAAVSSLPDDVMEQVSQHMSHSKSTSERYYRMRGRATSAVTAYGNIKQITSKNLML